MTALRALAIAPDPLLPAGDLARAPAPLQVPSDLLGVRGPGGPPLRCLRGIVLAAWRLLRCNPWSHGGVDFVEDQTLFRSPPRPEPHA